MELVAVCLKVLSLYLPGETADTINIGMWLFNNGNVRQFLTLSSLKSV